MRSQLVVAWVAAGTTGCGGGGATSVAEARPTGAAQGGAGGSSAAGGASASGAGGAPTMGSAGAVSTGGSGGAAPSAFVAVSAGGGHLCAVTSTGAVLCWGFGGQGQLGDGASTGFSASLVAAKISNATAVACGGEHTCAIAEGSVFCWGHDEYGQIGDGASGTNLNRALPIAVPLPEPVSAIAAGGLHYGGGHTCAIGTSGAVYCWGSNAGGQIGNGKSGFDVFVASPFRVDALNGAAIAIAAGGQHTCAIVAGGDVFCWGYDYDGQLGDGKKGSGAMGLSPGKVSGLPPGAIAITAGDVQTCAAFANGETWCWGEAGFGQFGVQTQLEMAAPTISFPGAPRIAIDQGAMHGCVVRVGGDVDCAGLDDLGEVGSGAGGPFMIHADPVHVAIHDAVLVTAGSSTSCALRKGGVLSCWGDWMGSTPVDVPPLATVGLGRNGWRVNVGMRSFVAAPGPVLGKRVTLRVVFAAADGRYGSDERTIVPR